MEKLRMKLSPRLTMVAGLVKKNSIAADIGTDHAYLPAYLVTEGISPRVIASDISEGPLKNAEKIIRNAKLENYITLRLSDGLEGYSPEDADTFIFAGMGGTLTVRLLEKIPWIKDSSKEFIFQPMSHSEDIISFLCENGFEITNELSCFDDGRCYIAFSARFTGVKTTPKASFPYVGLLDRDTSSCAKAFLQKQYGHISKKYDALSEIKGREEECLKLKAIRDEIKEML